jgi:cell division protein ZapA (FtsZ GTPase activity inhibitor)
MFTVHIVTNNAAFEINGGAEVARLLRDIADELDERGKPTSVCDPLNSPKSLRDINGNRVGHWQWMW